MNVEFKDLKDGGAYHSSFPIRHSKLESGQAMVEYLLVASAVIVALIGSHLVFKQAYKGLYQKIVRVVASPAP